MVAAEQLTAADAEHGEGPVWSPSWAGLRWVDMLAGDVLHLTDAGEVERWHVGSVAAALRPRAAGGVVIAVEHEFVLAEQPGGAVTSLGPVFTDPSVRFNEGGCDPDGNFIVGTMAYDEAPSRGVVYRLGGDHRVEVVLRDVTISNGLGWSAAGDTAFYVDTPTDRIDQFSWTSELGLHDRRPFARIDVERGHPDGLTVDAEGGVWVALWEGSAVHRYGPNGSLDEVIDVPVARVTACTFGGPALDQLFITTSRTGESDPVPGAGALFVAQPGVIGLATRPFRG